MELHEPPPQLHRAAPVPVRRSPERRQRGGAAWQQAAGTWTLVHEAFHLRHWRFRRNDAKVLCQTIVYFTDAMRLGATEQQANELYPYALALYRQVTQPYPWYRDPACIVPPWILPPRP